MKKIIALPLVFSLLLCILSGCTQADKIQTSDSVKTSDTLEITVDTINIFVPEDITLADGMDMIEIAVTLKNITDSDIVYSAVKFVLDVGDGNLIDTIVGYSYNADTMLMGGTLKKGETVSGTLIYEKPMGADMTLVYYGNGFEDSATGSVKVTALA